VHLRGGSSAFGNAVARPRDDRQKDLLRPALEEIIDLSHPLVRLSGEIDWGFLDRRFSSVCTPGDGRPPLPTRLVAGLFLLKHMHNLSDEALCARWLERLLRVLLQTGSPGASPKRLKNAPHRFFTDDSLASSATALETAPTFPASGQRQHSLQCPHMDGRSPR